jgi:uncharacterized protein YcfJ
MSNLFDRAIVRILKRKSPVGVGVMVTKHHILTCAHVVNSALGRPQSNPNQPEAECLVNLEFLNLRSPDTLTGKVVAWDNDIDVAVLYLKTPPPEDAIPAHFTMTKEVWGHQFRVYGVPAGHPYGSWASGVLRGILHNGSIQIEDTKEPGPRVEPGFSGGPVWDGQLRGVVGIVESTDKDSKTKTAYMVPTELIQKVWPELSTQSIRPVHDFYRHINLPTNYVPRPTLLAQVRKELLSTMGSVALTSGIKMNALHGMGGIGKSVVARALCDDPIVQASFPDGILWTTLGKNVLETDLKEKLREWITKLELPLSGTTQSIDILRDTLAHGLAEQNCLLVVDDVWKRRDVETFHINVPGCQLFLTTRNAIIAEELGARVQPIPEMPPDEAVTLLEHWAGETLQEKDETIKNEIAERLGYLPLAIKLAGSQLKHRTPEDWLASFAARKLKQRRVEHVHDSLIATFEMSLEELSPEERELYTSLAIFKEDEPIPGVVISRLWQALGGLELDECRRLSEDLASQALIQLERGQNNKMTDFQVVLHDLIRDLIADALGQEGHKKVHQLLLTAYQNGQLPAQWVHWAELEDDGYLYNHLAYHLDEIANEEDPTPPLIKLFNDQRWMMYRVAASNFTYDGYTADLMLAWQRVMHRAKKQIETSQPPIHLADCIRFALISTSINALAQNYVPELVARAIETGVWSANRGLSLAAKLSVSNAEKKYMFYQVLITTLSGEQQEQAIQASLEAALAISDEGSRASALGSLAGQLSGEQREKTIQTALDVALAILALGSRATALGSLAEQLSGEQREKAIQAALEAAWAISDERSRTTALGSLAGQLSGEQREKAIQAALEAAWAILDEAHRATALRDLAGQLSGEQVDRALDAALAISDERSRATALGSLAGQLSDEQVDRALDAALAISDEWFRATALGSLAGQLSGEQVDRALDAALAISDEWSRATALGSLAGQLSGEQVDRALDAALAISDEGSRATALGSLAGQLSGEQRETTIQASLEAALVISDEEHRATALGSLAGQLNGEQREKATQTALEAALAISDEEFRASAFWELAGQLSGEQREKAIQAALEAALAISDEELRATALGSLAGQLSGEQREKTIQAALEAALAILDEAHRATALRDLAGQLSGEQVARALEPALAIPDEAHRATALGSLAGQLSGEQREKAIQAALEAALAISDKELRATALRSLAGQLSGEQVARALEAALAISDERFRAIALRSLAGQLSGEQIDRALEAALAISDERFRATALGSLGGQLSDEQVDRALEAALAISDEGSRATTLGSLAGQLSGEQVDRALEAALAISDEWSRATALGSLAGQLSGEQVDRALDAALAISAVWNRTSALKSLAEQLSGEQVDRVLDAALAISDEWSRATALGSLAGQLSGEQIDRALDAALAISAVGNRAYALGGLAGQLSSEQIDRALEAALAISDEWFRATALGSLGGQLSGEQVDRALEAASAISNKGTGMGAILILLQSFPPSANVQKRIQLAFLDHLYAIRTIDRQGLLQLLAGCSEISSLATLNLQPQLYIDITNHVIEICTKWRWL